MVLPVHGGGKDGLLAADPRSARRDKLADPAVGLSACTAGAPARQGQEFADFRREHSVLTTLGAALELRLPLGEYPEDELINLDQNRFVISTQLGVQPTNGEWSFEVTGSLFLFADDDGFFNGNDLEQDTLFARLAYIVKALAQDWWIATSAADGGAAESTVNGVGKEDEKRNLLYRVSYGFRVNASQSVRLGYIWTGTQNDLGADTDSLVLGWSVRF